jgi:ribose transport system substrate-binding protein
MKKRLFYVLSMIIVLAMVLSACAPAATPTQAVVEEPEAPAAVEETEAPEEPAAASNPGLQMESAVVAEQFYSDEAFEESKQLMTQPPLNPDDPIYLQYLIDNPVNTTQYKKDPPYNICFSNAGVNNPWRVVGYVDMREQVEELRAEGLVKNFYHLDAQGKDEKQIADIQDLINTPGKCDLLIISPNTSEALTPAVEEACQALPVVVFDRGVLTDCPTVFEKTIGGYAFGISGAQFIVDNLPDGGNVLAFRILPGVDVLEQRWGAARKIFEENPQINVIGVEFVGYDSFQANTVVRDYIDRYGTIDAVWMDAGGTAVSILEAFEDAGVPYPKVINGEDQNDYLKFWKEKGLTAIAPTFPTFQWRTAVLAAVMILQGEPVQKRWVLPQPDVTAENLDQYYNPEMPPLHYALCGCEDMTNYPDAWKNVDVNKYQDVIE